MSPPKTGFALTGFWCSGFSQVSEKENADLFPLACTPVQAMFPPTADEEEFSEWQFSKFVYDNEDI